jgi:hypothetical protein
MTQINLEFLVSIRPTVGSTAVTGSAAIANAMMEDPT